ncbi:unnamed protein product, partial [Closterium sp. NIES-53]
GLTEHREPESCPVWPVSRAASPVRTARAGRVLRLRPPPVPGTHSMTLRPSTAPQRVPLPSPPTSSLPDGPDPESDSLRAASPTVTRFLATTVTDPLLESSAASALVAELVDFAAACRLDYATSLVAEFASASVCPPSVGGECALGTDVLEDRQEEFECFAAAVPHLVSMLLAREGDPDSPDIPTPRSYEEAIEGPYSSQWQAAMDAEMASWKSTGTYQPPLEQPPLDPEQPPLAPEAAAPGAAAPGPRAAAPGAAAPGLRAAAPGSRYAAPGPATPPLDPVQPPAERRPCSPGELLLFSPLLQRRPRESLTPQQLREWYTSWGCGGSRRICRPGAGQLGASGSGQLQLQRRPRETLTSQQLHEWYAHSRGSLSTVRCPYVICTSDRTGQTCGTLSHTQSRCFARLSDAWRIEFGDEAELPDWVEVLGQRVDIFALDYDAILTAIYALPTSADRTCHLCAPPDPGIEPAALGAGEAAALGASASPALGAGEGAAPGAGESALFGTAPAEALYTFTLDSDASRSFFRNSTTLTPLSRLVPVSLADPSGGPVLARSSTVLPCPAVPSGSLSGLHLPSFSTNLVSGADLQDQWVDQFTPGGQRVTHCTCSRTGRHLATFTRAPGCRFSLPSHPRLLLPVFPVSRDSSASLLTPPRSLPQRLPCRLSTWTCGAQPASVDKATSGTSCSSSTITRLRERFGMEFPVLRLHYDRGGEFSTDLLAALCAEHGIRQTFTLPASPQQNGVAERRIGLVMEVARTSMIHAAATHFLWPFAVWYAAHQLNLWPRVSLPETSPTLLWTGKVGDASRFRVWGARAFVRDTTADKLSARTAPCVFLGFVPDAPGWQFYHPTSRRVFPSQDVTFDESVPFYCVSQVDPPPLTSPVEVTGDSGPAEGGPTRGAASGGAEPGGAEPGGC